MTIGARRYPIGCVVVVAGRDAIVRNHVERFGQIDPVYRVEVRSLDGAQSPTFVDVRESEIQQAKGGWL